jgi:hypothetical protein
MQDSNKREPKGTAPDTDATSEETLEDVEESEKKTGTSGAESGESDVPSPDGAHDDSPKPDDAGPM